MRKKFLVICGPTAVGKTGLGLKLAKIFNGEIVSADSRQVYRGVDVGTGKDLDDIRKEGIKIWGYDLVDPQEKFSVAQYQKIGRKIMDDIWARGKLPIVVGGTGLYIKALVDGIDTVRVKPDSVMRKRLGKESAVDLWERLVSIDPVRARAMNESDRKNPRRLVRAIEIARIRNDESIIKSELRNESGVLMIGLKLKRGKLNERIEKRVERRIEMGVLEEVQVLLESGVDLSDQVMSSMGYKQLRDYFESKGTLEEGVKSWEREEKRYAKRQMTWFKKDGRIEWFDVGERGWKARVEARVQKWYKKGSL